MYKLLFLGIIMFSVIFVSAQKDDLIVTTDGDSIACEIVEVNDSEISFIMSAFGRKNVKTTTSREKVLEYKYDVIRKDAYIFKSGTSYIIGKKYQYIPGTHYAITSKTYTLENLQNASGEELEYYRYKAVKLQKTGRTLNIVGASTFGVSTICALATSEAWGLGALIFTYPALAGLGTVLVGLPINLTGKTRVEQINMATNSAFNDISIDIQPSFKYDQISQNYQTGITLNISF